MDLIDKDIIENCIKDGEEFRRKLQEALSYSNKEDLHRDIVRWWEHTVEKVKSAESIYTGHLGGASIYMMDDPIATLQGHIDSLHTLLRDEPVGPRMLILPNFNKDDLRLLYSTNAVFDADDVNNHHRLNKGFRRDLFRMQFSNPAKPRGKIPVRELEELNPEYSEDRIRGKDGYLNRLYKEWSKVFGVDKKVIKDMISLERSKEGSYVLISKGIQAEGYATW